MKIRRVKCIIYIKLLEEEFLHAWELEELQELQMLNQLYHYLLYKLKTSCMPCRYFFSHVAYAVHVLFITILSIN